MKIFKRIVLALIIIVFMVAPATLAVLGILYPTKAGDIQPIYKPAVRLADIHIPEGLREEGFGLFWLDYKTDTTVKTYKSTTPEAKELFDPDKPVMIFVHGLQGGSGGANDENFDIGYHWLDAGYNAAIFYWSQFADEKTPGTLDEKIWGTKDMKYPMRWAYPGSKSYETEDIPDHSLAEIFSAYYLDFMEGIGEFNGNEIRITGLSMGGPFVLGVMSYITTKASQGMFPLQYVPDRIALFDPYFAIADDYGVYIDWLGENMNKKITNDEGVTANRKSIDFMAEVAESIGKFGVAIEVIPTYSGIVPFMAILDGDTSHIFNLYSKAQTLLFRTPWILAVDFSKFNEYHLGGRQWYYTSLKEEILIDNCINNNTDYAMSAKTPLSYVMSKMGVLYEMEDGVKISYKDDVLYSTNLEKATVAGFAFNDMNANGVYDDRIQARLSGVKVELYLKSGNENRLLGSCITDNRGFYKFDVDITYANGFDKLYVKAYAPQGFAAMTVRSNLTDMMNNDINPDGLSDLFILPHRLSTQIINIGIKG